MVPRLEIANKIVNMWYNWVRMSNEKKTHQQNNLES
jgi:hypothetical protein